MISDTALDFALGLVSEKCTSHHALTKKKEEQECSPVDLVLTARPDWSQTINLIEEDDGWTHLVRLETIQSRDWLYDL